MIASRLRLGVLGGGNPSTSASRLMGVVELDRAATWRVDLRVPAMLVLVQADAS